MYVRILVAREADIAKLTGLLRGYRCLESAVGSENAVRIAHANHFMKLDQVDGIGLETAQRILDLFGSRILHLAVNLGHEEYLPAVAVLQGLAHADLALPVVVVPAVV